MGSFAEIIGAVQSTLGLIALCLMLVFALSSKLEQTHRLRIIYTLFAVIALLCTSLFLPYIFSGKPLTVQPFNPKPRPDPSIPDDPSGNGDDTGTDPNNVPPDPAKAEMFDFGEEVSTNEYKSIPLGEKSTLSTLPSEEAVLTYTNVNQFCYYLSSRSSKSREELPLGPKEQNGLGYAYDQISIYQTEKDIKLIAYISPEGESELKRFSGSVKVKLCTAMTSNFSSRVGIPINYVKDISCKSLKDAYQRELYILTLTLEAE